MSEPDCATGTKNCARFQGVKDIPGAALAKALRLGIPARTPWIFREEVVRLAYLGTPILMDTGAVISAKPLSAEAYNEDGALMLEIRRYGIDL